MKRVFLFTIGILISLEIWSYSFKVDNVYYNILSSNTVEVTYKSGYNTYSGEVVIPSSVNYNNQVYSVKGIGHSAFLRSLSFVGPTSVTLPNTITKIGVQAFFGCSALTSFDIPNSVDTIDYGAFSNCTKLESIQFPSSLVYIGDYAFSVSGLCSVNIPITIKEIGGGAFSGCENLITVTTKDGYNGCFRGAPNLKTIIIPDGVKEIKQNAFSDLRIITNVSIPSTVITIGERAFSSCVGLTSISIPSSVTSIGNFSFQGCVSLKEFCVDSKNNFLCSIDGVMFNKSKTTLIFYPNNKSSQYAIPPSVTSLDKTAFSYCRDLKSITIPSSVTSIGEYAFEECAGLSEIHCQRKTPISISSLAFLGMDKSLCKLYVPKGSYDLYAAARNWCDFINIIEEEVTDVKEVSSDNQFVYAGKQEIVIKGAEPVKTVEVYTVTGVLVKAVKVDNEIRIPVSSRGVYLVRVGSKLYKVAL